MYSGTLYEKTGWPGPRTMVNAMTLFQGHMLTLTNNAYYCSYPNSLHSSTTYLPQLCELLHP